MIDLEFKQIEKIIMLKSFQKSEGISNEVAYYVYDYDPNKEMQVRENVQKMVRKYEPGRSHVSILHMDIYDVMLEYIDNLGLLNQCYQMETQYGFDYLHASLSDLLRMDYDNNFFVDYLNRKSAEYNEPFVVFVTGVGKVYPIVRAHNILNKLHLNYDRSPVIFFYPGKYDGQSFKLFDKIKDENYYRAFPMRNLFKIQGGDY